MDDVPTDSDVSDQEGEDNQGDFKKTKNERSHSFSLGELSDEEKKKKGVILTDENQEETRVGFQVYKDYQRLNGGWSQLFWVNFVLLAFILCKVISDYTVGSWAISED